MVAPRGMDAREPDVTPRFACFGVSSASKVSVQRASRGRVRARDRDKKRLLFRFERSLCTRARLLAERCLEPFFYCAFRPS